MARSERRQIAINHAIRTTGTIMWCSVGIYSGDGKRALDPRHSYDVPTETKRFLATHCVRFTGHEMTQAAQRAAHQEYRLRKLAKLAIDEGKYESAKKLCDLAENARETRKEITAGERSMYRIKTEGIN